MPVPVSRDRSQQGGYVTLAGLRAGSASGSWWAVKIAVVKRAIDVGLFGELADPRVALAAVACATSRVRIGALR
jgi:hypothetical protein